MAKIRLFAEETGLLLATTIGAGVFVLPYLFTRSGYLVGALYLAALSGLIIFAHTLFARVIARTGGKHHLLGLAQEYLGRGGFFIAIGAGLCNLFLSLVAYLVLAGGFVRFVVPAAPWPFAVFMFWLAASIPLAFRVRRFADAEFIGTVVKSAIIVCLFLAAPDIGALLRLPAIRMEYAAELFGPVLFALAGWTAIPAIYDLAKRSGRSERYLYLPSALGTVLCAALYGAFALAITGYNGNVTPDTISGLAPFPLLAGVVATFGIFAIWTSYLSLGREIVRSLEQDLRWHVRTAQGAVFVIPPILVLFGFNDFLLIIGFIGGVFVSAQYALIVLIARRALRLGHVKRFFADLVIATFTLAALYEIYVFLV